MKNIFIKLVFSLISIVGFANKIPYQTTLTLTKINGKLVEQRNIQLTIDSEKQIIFGSSGCNNFSLNYISKVNTNCIKTKFPIGTRMACEQTIMKSETDFINTIKGRKFKIKTKENKVLFKNWLGKTILEFEIKTDENQWSFIEKNKWKLISLDNTSKNYENVFLQFNVKENKISGNTGCNGFSGTYQTKGNNIEFGQIISTLMSCLDQESSQTERDFMRVLSNKNLRFDLADQTLNFYDENSSVMIFGITDQEY